MKPFWNRWETPYPDSVAFIDDLSDILVPDQDSHFQFPSPDKTEKRLILLHTGRCGSTLLHHHLLSRKICPPFEIFNRTAIDPILNSLKSSPPFNIYDYLLSYRKMMLRQNLDNPNAVVSYSFNAWSLLWVVNNAPKLAEWLFRGSRVVLLHRRNIVRQAISYTTAISKGKWHSYDASNNLKEISQSDTKRMVAKYLDMILWAENAIETKPLYNLIQLALSNRALSYESLIENPMEISSMILSDLNVISELYQPDSTAKIPNKLHRSEDLYQEILGQIPMLLPSGFEFTKSFFFARLTD